MKAVPPRFSILLVIFCLIAVPSFCQTWGSPVWADEFDGTGAPDSTKWTYDTGNLNVNNELEIYCSPTMTTQGCDPLNPNAFLDGSGHLVIQQRLVNGTTWTSARLKTQGVKTFQYGRIEANLRVPSHQGLWPAFWMLGSNIDTAGWPSCGEADIMENWPSLGGNGLNHNATSMHGQGYSGGNSLTSLFTFPQGQDVTSFHTYGIVWSKDMMQLYLDDPSNITFIRTPADVPAGTMWPFNNPFFLIVNMAVGGSLGGTPDGGTASAAPAMTIDYVRYYQAQQILGPTMTPAGGIAVHAGGSANATVNLTSAAGNGFVYLSCSGAPAKATCSIDTGNSLNSHVADFRTSATGSTTVRVTTTANTAQLVPSRPYRVWASVVGIAGLFVLPFARRNSARVFLVVGTFGLFLTAISLLACGGGSSSGTSSGGSNGTPTGHYTLIVTATTVSGDSSTANVSLDVN